MAGRKPALAVRAYVGPLQRAISCVTLAVIKVGGYDPDENPHALTLGEPVALRGSGNLSLAVSQRYEIVPAEGIRGPWKCHSIAYIYAINDADGEIISYHWQPYSSFAEPHMHVRDQGDRHIPSGRISLEEVIRLAITDYGATPLRPDWEDVLNETQGNFEDWRTWPDPR